MEQNVASTDAPYGDAEEATPIDPRMEKISQFVCAHFKHRKWQGVIQEKIVPAESLASPEGLLPLFVARAARRHQEIMGKALPLLFQTSSWAVCGVVPGVMPDQPWSFAQWSHFLHFSIEEEAKAQWERVSRHEPIELAKLYNEFVEALDNKDILVIPAPQPGMMVQMSPPGPGDPRGGL